ncbi:MAG: UDP-N-acetylenolpyruvoylglucosamine reductase [Bacteroidetes bacterium]|nr:MAG: UDP-N-acetylenolpyruvoylglucosamine reductase [Bacteroidota bacterium]
MKVESKTDLTNKLTFHVPATTRFYVEVATDDDVREALLWARNKGLEILILGGGSNMLFHSDFEGLVINIVSTGMAIEMDDGRFVEVVAEAGEVWHKFVLQTLENGWGGLENLSLIPGCVGASPMQNIGAYGVEIKDVFSWLEAINVENGELKRFNIEECKLGYRESVFKRELKGKWVIVRVAFHLDRESELKTSYGAIESELSEIPTDLRTHKDVSNAVIKIRNSKLPNPDELGNAGSFFKNPVIIESDFKIIQKNHSDIPFYPQEDGKVKLAAGWLIDQAGWKGHDRITHAVHDKQALVLVNKGGATGNEIWTLALDVMRSVEKRFGLQLEVEVNQIGIKS